MLSPGEDKVEQRICCNGVFYQQRVLVSIAKPIDSRTQLWSIKSITQALEAQVITNLRLEKQKAPNQLYCFSPKAQLVFFSGRKCFSPVESGFSEQVFEAFLLLCSLRLIPNVFMKRLKERKPLMTSCFLLTSSLQLWSAGPTEPFRASKHVLLALFSCFLMFQQPC